ncbi:hypothetical protein BDR05DRAFT_1044546, partial [Suillus weaverae]
MEEAINDYVCWSSLMPYPFILFYNAEQSMLAHDVVASVLVREQRVDPQDAVDYSYQLCKGTSSASKTTVLSSPRGEKRLTGRWLSTYNDWMTDSLHWSFDFTCYLGKDGHTLKRDWIINLLPEMTL